MTQRRIYQEEYPYFITFRTKEGFELFEEMKYARLMADIMFNAGELKQYDVLAYQIMPDHVHLLVYQSSKKNIHRAYPSAGALNFEIGSAGRDAHARRNYNVSQLIHAVKSFYCDQIRCQNSINYPIFQRRFYTRIISNRKYLKNILWYIGQNPVKSKLSKRYQNMPYQYFNRRLINKLF